MNPHKRKRGEETLPSWVDDQGYRTNWEVWREDRSFSTTTTPQSSRPSTPRSTKHNNKRKKGAGDERRRKEEEELVERFNRLTFLGRTVKTRDLDTRIIEAEADSVFLEFWNLNPELFEEVKPAEWVFVEANSVVELNHLDRFNREYAPLKDEYAPFVEAAADYVSHLLALPTKLPFPEKGDLEKVRFIGSKYPGLEYAVHGHKSRVDADSAAQIDAEYAWDQLMSGEKMEPHVNRIGGRGKLTSREKLEKTADKPTSGRLIFMTSQRDLKLNGVTEQKLTDAYKPEQYPISVGKMWWHGGVAEFVERFSKFEMFSCFDAAKFDSSLPPWLIRLAVNILRDQFEDGMDPQYDAYWNFVFDGLVYAPVYLDNGLKFQRQGGSTSGHSFNTLMQSVCTLIICYTCFFKLLGLENAVEVTEDVWVEGLGDDQHTGAKGRCAKLTIESTAPVAMECFGVDWFGDKSFNTDLLLDLVVGAFQGTQYLGKFFRFIDENVGGTQVQGVIPYRPFRETVLKLLYPERGEFGDTESWMRAVGHYADAAGNEQTRNMLEKYLDFLEPRIIEDEVVWSEKWTRKFSGGNPIGRVPVPTRRIAYEEWLGLVLLNE